ncbi:acyl-CoA N-acyltransferase [Sporodiniella umbellata]|nr:acyl-CoA N-acyltransferase [Sporodiniella umbellata]
MSKYSNVRIIHAVTPEDLEKCSVVRHAVFVEEQKYTTEIEKDGLDSLCQHWVAVCDRTNADGTADYGVPVGNVRLIPKSENTAKLGRLAVFSQARGLYIGQKLVKTFIEYCKTNSYSTIVLHSQYDRRGFYEKLGFVTEKGDDEVFIESTTPHIRMWMRNL